MGYVNLKLNHRGFTLIELVVVLVVLGILAASALPKLADLSKDGRIAAVQGLEAAIRSELSMVYSKCAVSTATCDVNAAYWPLTNLATVTLDGVTHRLQYGHFWPDQSPVGGGLSKRIDTSGFTLSAASTHTTYYYKDGAPDPSNCYVYYNSPIGPGQPPRITVQTTGC